MTIFKKSLFWLPTIAWMAVIFYLSAQSGENLQSLFPFLENFDFGHPIAYFILALSCYFSLTKSVDADQPYLWILIIVFIYSLSDEFHQKFVPGRQADIYDLLLDLLGAAVAIGLISLIKKRPKQIT